MLNRKLAIVTVGLVGVAVTGLEVASARLLAPFFGSTIFVYGSAIGIALLALALGYSFGGRLADRHPSRTWLSAIVAIAGLTAAAIPLIFRPVAETIDRVGAGLNLPSGLLVVVAMAVLFIIPIMALGAVSPFVLRLSLRSIEETGQWSGLLSGLATGGSIFGTFLATFVTIPLLGTRETILGSAGVLVILGAALGPWAWRYRVLPCVLVAWLAVLGLSGPFLRRPGLIWERESPYELVQVLEQRGTRFLIADAGDGAQSVYRPGTPYTGTIYDIFALLPYLAAGDGQRRSVLVVGLAGGSMVRLYRETLEQTFDFDVTGVEIDREIVAAGQRYFGLDELGVEIIIDDARRYLKTTDEKFDVIIVDAYVHELSIPPLLATQEFFQSVADHLAPGGVVGMNVVVRSGSTFFDKFLATVRSVFPDVRTAPFIAGAENNFVLAGQSVELTRLPSAIAPEIDRFLNDTIPHLRRIESSGERVYTDNQTDIELRLKT